MSLSRPKRSCAPRVLAADREQLAWVRSDRMGAEEIAFSQHLSLAETLRPDICTPGTIDVIAANDLALHWVQTPPASLASFRELRLVALARCTQLFGGSPDDWRVGADWHATRPFVCVALPLERVVPVEQQLAALKLAARWHSAWSVLVCGVRPQTFPNDGWCALRSPSRVLLWHCRRSQVDRVAAWACDAREASATAALRAAQQMTIEMSRTGDSSEEPLHWMDLVADRPVADGELAHVIPVKHDSRFAGTVPLHSNEAAAALALQPLLGTR